MRLRGIAFRETSLLILALAGCERQTVYTHPDELSVDGPACDGVCATVAPLGWHGPTIIGAAASPLSCPAMTPHLGFQGYADLNPGSLACPACTCGPASCALPTTGRASSSTCGGAGAVVSFGAPDAWEGTCTIEDAIAAGSSCSGAPCLSWTVDPPTVQPCAPQAAAPEQREDPAWGLVARECLITLSDVCDVEGTICAPPPPMGFALCVYRAGEVATCPIEYSSRLVVYSDVKDGRVCSPCSCGEPAGATCSAYVEAFADDACASPVAALSVVAGEPSKCADVPVGVALGSKRAELLVDEPGTCAATGGEPSGAVTLLGAVTLCCRPEDLAR